MDKTNDVVVCRWSLTSDDWNVYSTDCDHDFQIMEGDIAENGFKFCPYCGKPISEVGQSAVSRVTRSLLADQDGQIISGNAVVDQMHRSQDPLRVEVYELRWDQNLLDADVLDQGKFYADSNSE